MIAQFSAVEKSYGKTKALKAADFTLRSGETVALLGLNGSGKSTTLKLLAGLLLPSRGSITVEGRSPHDNRALISYLGDREGFYAWMKPAQVLFYMNSLFRGFNAELFQSLLQRLDVPDRSLQQMSKGQRQRLRLAATLARPCRLFILDEPLSGIDVVSRALIVETIKGTVNNQATILIATHEIKEIEEFFDRALILKDGDLLSEKTRAELAEEGGLAQHFVNLHRGR